MVFIGEELVESTMRRCARFVRKQRIMRTKKPDRSGLFIGAGHFTKRLFSSALKSRFS
jgi:hypothetical protein